MTRTTPAVLRHTEIDPNDCPVLTGQAAGELRTAIHASSRFSLAVLEFLKDRSAREQAAWIKRSVDSSRALFQPWAIEILYVLGTLGRTRFTQLADLLGLSSRTLSDKLKSLREMGLVDRQVFDEQPVRIEYYLTKHGRATAAAASPLIAHLTHGVLHRSKDPLRAPATVR